jgi:hypothetical protein
LRYTGGVKEEEEDESWEKQKTVLRMRGMDSVLRVESC